MWAFGHMRTGWRPSSGSRATWATTRPACSSRSREARRRSTPSSDGSQPRRPASHASTPSTRPRSLRSANGRFASPRASPSRGYAHLRLPTSPYATTASASCSMATTAAIATRSSTARTAARASRSRSGSRTTGPTRRWRASRCAAACAHEYHDPDDRRFHAQPLACPACGPRIWFDASTAITHGTDPAIAATQRTLAGGAIVAIKGVGGFHLACDARSHAAVALLRQRKHRAAKPLAVMVRDLAAAEGLAEIDGRGGRAPDQPAAAHRPAAPPGGRRAVAARCPPQPVRRHRPAVRATPPRSVPGRAGCRRPGPGRAGHDQRKPQRRAHLP